jgi:glycosyltransferase involved in cell wall biosynthesis
VNPHPSTSISVVIPLLNEQDTLRTLRDRLVAMSIQHDIQLQILFVDDGSTDASWSVIETLAKEDDRVVGIRFRRNFGKAAALAAGIERSTSPIIVTMDADLQDDPDEVPKLLAKIGEGFDCVSGWKQKRHDPWHKTLPSKLFNWAVGRFTGLELHDHNCGLKAYQRQIFNEVQLYGEMHRFVPVLAAARGFRVTEVPVVHHPRLHGQSKYGLSRLPKGFLDLMTVCLLTEYRQRPIHLLGSLGLLSLGVGSLLMVWLTLSWIVTRSISWFEPINLHERAVFYYAIVALIVGVQMVSMGILAELIIAAHRPNTVPYSICEQTASKTNDSTH